MAGREAQAAEIMNTRWGIAADGLRLRRGGRMRVIGNVSGEGERATRGFVVVALRL